MLLSKYTAIMYKIGLLFIIILFPIALALVNQDNKKYGLFNLTITGLDLCKGPKRKDCSINSASIKNNISIAWDYNVIENVSPTKGKVVAISNGNEMLRLQINNPCSNIFMRPVLQSLFNATNSCTIKKGRYIFTLDFQDALRKYYGGKHLYGIWIFRTLFYANYCNFVCSAITVNIYANH